jgi:hypothetical protein
MAKATKASTDALFGCHMRKVIGYDSIDRSVIIGGIIGDKVANS